MRLFAIIVVLCVGGVDFRSTVRWNSLAFIGSFFCSTCMILLLPLTVWRSSHKLSVMQTGSLLLYVAGERGVVL
jgi:hypothetical protein